MSSIVTACWHESGQTRLQDEGGPVARRRAVRVVGVRSVEHEALSRERIEMRCLHSIVAERRELRAKVIVHYLLRPRNSSTIETDGENNDNCISETC